MVVIETIKYFLGQIIFFTIPLVILRFIAPAIAELKSNASRFMGVTVLLSYLSSVGAAAFAMVSGYAIIPHLSIASNVGNLREIPNLIMELNIPQVFSIQCNERIGISFIGVAALGVLGWDGYGILRPYYKLVGF